MGQTYAATFGVNTEAEDHILKASKVVERMDESVDTTSGNATFTAAQVLGGLIVRDCVGSARSDVLPTAALLVAAMKEPKVGDIVKCLLVNNSDAAETITVVAGTGGDFTQISATRDIAQNTSRMLYIRLTDVDASPAYLVYM
jgi:hypothetical protein